MLLTSRTGSVALKTHPHDVHGVPRCDNKNKRNNLAKSELKLMARTRMAGHELGPQPALDRMNCVKDRRQSAASASLLSNCSSFTRCANIDRYVGSRSTEIDFIPHRIAAIAAGPAPLNSSSTVPPAIPATCKKRSQSSIGFGEGCPTPGRVGMSHTSSICLPRALKESRGSWNILHRR